MFSKQHYEFFADFISAYTHKDAGNEISPSFFAIFLAKKFKAENPRFDEDRFFEACGRSEERRCRERV